MKKDYPSAAHFAKLCPTLYIFLSNDFVVGSKIKPKRETQIRINYGKSYNAQLEILSEIKKIEMSHLLGCNEVFVPVMVEEFSRCAKLSKILHAQLKKMSQYKEIATLGEIEKLSSQKQWSDLLYKDLEHAQNKLNIDIDIKQHMKDFKDSQKETV